VTESAATTVFVVDDEPAVARAIARMLRSAGWRVETFASAEAFLDGHDGRDGCIVLDVDLPGLDGLALQQRLRDSGGGLPIVFLTGHGDIPMSVRAMKAGAADFLTKPVGAETLTHAVRSAIDQHAAASRRTHDGELVRRRIAQLSERERQILDAIADGKLNKQIAYELGVVEQTVKYHRARLMRALQAKSLAELMHLVAVARG
jgi:FixJ family two-component response regulator